MKEACRGQFLPVPCLSQWKVPVRSLPSYKDELNGVKGMKEVPPQAFRCAQGARHSKLTLQMCMTAKVGAEP